MEVVSPRVGFIRSFSKAVRGVEEPSPPIMYQATLAHFDYRLAPPEERVGIGKGLTDEDAMRAAFGEAIEHYCAAQVDSKRPDWRAGPKLKTAASAPQSSSFIPIINMDALTFPTENGRRTMRLPGCPFGNYLPIGRFLLQRHWFTSLRRCHGQKTV